MSSSDSTWQFIIRGFKSNEIVENTGRFEWKRSKWTEIGLDLETNSNKKVNVHKYYTKKKEDPRKVIRKQNVKQSKAVDYGGWADYEQDPYYKQDLMFYPGSVDIYVCG